MKLRLPLIVGILGVCAVRGQAPPCDPQLIRATTDPNGYRLRGDRCEGVYVQEVGGAPLAIVSWTQSFPPYNLASKQPLQWEWDSAGRGTARLRAQSLRRRFYYQMDAVREPGSNSYRWPMDLLAGLEILQDELGVIGITRGLVGQVERDVFLPLRIGQGGKPIPSTNYRLILLPGVELKEVFLTLAAVQGTRETIVKNGEPVGFGYYPAERPVAVTLPAPRERGIYRLEIGATLKSGGASTMQMWFFHGGNR